jgi:phage host-nuclease inhibitor protein Gam
VAKRAKVSRLKSWQEVDEALRRIGEIDRAVHAAELDLNKKIDALKKDSAEKVRAQQEEKALLEGDLEVFAECNREDFAGKQTRELTFGEVGWRRSRSLTIHNMANTVSALETIHGKKAELYLLRTVKANKEALEQLDPESLKPLGVSVREKEEFRYQVHAEELVQ